MAAPIQNQVNGDEINCDMPKSNEKVSIRRAKRCNWLLDAYILTRVEMPVTRCTRDLIIRTSAVWVFRLINSQFPKLKIGRIAT